MKAFELLYPPEINSFSYCRIFITLVQLACIVVHLAMKTSAIKGFALQNSTTILAIALQLLLVFTAKKVIVGNKVDFIAVLLAVFVMFFGTSGFDLVDSLEAEEREKDVGALFTGEAEYSYFNRITFA